MAHLPEHFRNAVLETYGWKSPVETTKTGEPSLVLWLLAFSMFLIRLIWLSQFLKLVYRCINAPSAEIPPLLAEIYLLTSFAFEIAVGVSAYCNFVLVRVSTTFIGIICIWKIFESLSNNLYYLLLRPALELKAPHSTYRSFAMAALAFVEVWLVLSLAWYFIGTTTPQLDSFLTAIYFTSTTFFTVGYGDYSPTGDLSHALAVFTMFSATLMLAVVLSRALSLVRPLPNPTDHP